MITAFTANQPRAATLSDGLLISQRNFKRSLNRFRTTIGIKNMVHTIRRQLNNPVSQFKRFGMPQLKRRRVIKFSRLFLYRLGNQRPAMASIHTPQTSCAVQNLLTIRCGKMHIFRPDKHARVFLKLAVIGEWHPKCT